MASASEIAKQYFAAVNAHDLDAAYALWAPTATGRFVGSLEFRSPGEVRGYFEEVIGAFPDFSLELIDATTARNRTAIRWRARGTFAGPGSYQGYLPNGARVEIEGCDVLTVAGDLIQSNDAYTDGTALARQLGVLPPPGSRAEQRLTSLANVRTRVRQALHGAREESIADGVWVVRGGRPRTMNVYLIADMGGVTVFDAGISDMTHALAAIGARLGGIRRVVLSHADADHRGAASGLGAPVFCHPAERAAAESPETFRDYWDLTKLYPPVRRIYPTLLRMWDGGAVAITGTVSEGDEVGGFRVVELPGHAPGLIGLFRESDRLALVSDCFYTLDPRTGRKNAAHVPHPAFNVDTEQARASIRRLASIRPSAAWAGHANPVTGDVVAQLERAAAAPA